jgi:uncharacterized Zn finger protein (UPF0148 family)
MPIYECPKCGRLVEKPTGSYYCRVCGPEALMEEIEVPEIKFIWVEKEAQYRLRRPIVVEEVAELP